MGKPIDLKCYNLGDCKLVYSNRACIAPPIRFVSLYISLATAQSGKQHNNSSEYEL